MELEKLRIFVRAAETASFSKAAAELFISHSTVSRTVASLEAELGKKLVERTNSVIGLTPEGEHLLIRAKELLVLADRISEEIHNM